jgi:hypothetical protein
MSQEEMMALMQESMAAMASMGYAIPADSQAAMNEMMAMLAQC